MTGRRATDALQPRRKPARYAAFRGGGGDAETQLGFIELRRTERSIWLRQPGTNVDLQFSRSETTGRDTDKLRSQVSFLSETPREALGALADWARGRGLQAMVGGYSEREFYLDLAEAFVDFVMEAMRPELAEYGVSDRPTR